MKVTTEQLEKATELYKQFMDVLGIPESIHSVDTPRRVAKMMLVEKCRALREDPPVLTTFDATGDEGYVVVKGIKYWTLCAHHHVPFYGEVDIVYHPSKKIVGLSKFARIVEYFASKPQIQEEFTKEIIKHLYEALSPVGILVRVSGAHMCVESRGAKAQGMKTITQQIAGDIDKAEVSALLKKE